MGQGGDGAVSDLCLESSLGPFNVSSISVYDKQPCVAGQGKNHASGRPDTAAHPVCIQSHAQTWPGVLVTSFCHSGEQRDKQVTTAASSPISGFRAFPLTPSDGESPLSMGYGESSSPQLLLLLDSFMHRQTQTNGSGVCNIFQQKDPFFFNLTLLIPFSHMPVPMNEA